MNLGALARMNYPVVKDCPVAVPKLRWAEPVRKETVQPERKAAQSEAGLPSEFQSALSSAFPAVLPFYKADTLDTQTTIENGSRIFTVVEILKEVFHEDFRKAISRYMSECPEGVAKAVGVQNVSDVRLVLLSEPKVESSLHQPACATAVDLLFSAIVEVHTPQTIPISLSDCDSGTDAENTETATPRIPQTTRITTTSRHRIEFRMRYYIRLWDKTCSAPVIAPKALFPVDDITEQKTAITNQYLLPVMYAKDYAETARRLLWLHYREALTAPTAVDGWELAKRMNLEVRKVRFEKNSDIQGRIYFDWTSVRIVDENGEGKVERIPPMTILVNSELCTSREVENSTIIHECCHVFLDLPFFKLQMLGGRPYTSFTSRKRKKKGFSQTNSPIDWMELQAEKLPAYILMEEENTRKLIEKLLKERGGERSPENMLRVMQKLALHFNVSRSMAKYRMIELGYPEADGVYSYVDGHRIPDHGCSSADHHHSADCHFPGSHLHVVNESSSDCGMVEHTGWKSGTTYTISRSEAANLLRESAEFRAALMSGCYTYVEGHYCLDDEKYVRRGYRMTAPSLTDYARHHMDECCLSFSIRGRYTHVDYELQQAARKKEFKNKYLSRHDLDAEPETKERVLQNSRFAEDAEIWMRIKRNLPEDFKDAVQYIIDQKGISQNELAMRMGVSRASFQKWCTGSPSVRQVVALCIAMDVRADVGEELLHLAGLAFRNDLENNLLHGMLFETRDLTVGRANEIMRQNKLKPLTNSADEELAEVV